MDASRLIDLLVTAALGTLVLWVVIPQVRFHFRMFRSRKWPFVQGTVQKGEVLHAGSGKWIYLPFRSLLGYAYKVDRKPYWGLFVLAAEDMQVAEKLQKQADGHSVKVQYDPKDPAVSLLADRELLGRRINQDPMWLD